MAKGSFKQFVEQKLGKIPHFIISVLLEWILIFVLFVDGLIAFVANEFARFFDLRMPCLLCTRIDHLLVPRDPDFYYNDSICESHRKDVSSLAYCHLHHRLSDIRQMCEGCLLSFATENQHCDTYKSLVGILGGDLECSGDENNNKMHVALPDGTHEEIQVEKSSIHKCSCCGESLRVKTTFQEVLTQVETQTPNAVVVPQAPAPSPRGLVMTKNEEPRSIEQLSQMRYTEPRSVDPLSHIRYTELKFMSDNESEIPEDEDGSVSSALNQSKEDPKAATVPLLTESEDPNDESCKTPSFIRAHRFFGFAFTDSASASPRGPLRFSRRLLHDKGETPTEPLEGSVSSETDREAILHRLKKQVRLDRKSLIALYMELDEERSASAVAANQAMAMITRLQAEKAAVQMEALQYQRMMEEQAEYDQEAIQVLKDRLAKREEEVKVLEEEVRSDRQKLGEPIDTEGCRVRDEDEYQRYKYRSNSSLSQISECGRPPGHLGDDDEFKCGLDQTGPSQENGWPVVDEDPLLDQESEKMYLLERLRMLEKIHAARNSKDPSMAANSEINLKEDGRGDLSREISNLSNRLEAIENDRDFLKHAFQSLQKGDEGTQLLREIAQHLRGLRHVEA